jgi:hypothetical protein
VCSGKDYPLAHYLFNFCEVSDEASLDINPYINQSVRHPEKKEKLASVSEGQYVQRNSFSIRKSFGVVPTH